MHPISLVSDADFDDSTDVDGEKHSQSRHHRGFHRRDRWSRTFSGMLCLCLALVKLLHSVAPPSSSLVTMAVLIPHWVVNSDRLSPEEDRLREDHNYESLAFSRHTIDLEFDDETMRPEKDTEASRNARTDPSTIKMKQWYQGQDRLSDKSQWQWPSNRVSDEEAPTGTNRASYHAREPTEDDDERLAMRKSDMPPPVPERTANPRIREDRAIQDFR